MTLPVGPYDIVYADPPWPFHNYSDGWHEKHPSSRWVGRQYGLMDRASIMALPVADIAAKDAALLLWATMPNLDMAMACMRAWGFTYKTCAFVWVKTNPRAGTPFIGMGYYTRSNAELCLLGVRGKPLPRLSRSISQIVHSPVLRHSEKPSEVRERIVGLFGDRPRIELFARERVAGWDVWGDEVAA